MTVAVALFGLALAFGLVVLAAFDGWRAPQIVVSDPLPGTYLTVAVEGAVATPGVYVVESGSRIADVLWAAGGATDAADLAAINLAKRVRDEDRLIIPPREDGPDTTGIDLTPPTDVPGAGYGFASVFSEVVDINTADLDELDALPGIGPVLAALIVEERARRGGFRSVDELVAISGISQRMVDELRDRITT
ncbi:hypothetical protein BH23CHL5_BH23CHL5_01370 [soil metagenome]